MIKRVVSIHVHSDKEKEELLREIERKRFPVVLYVHAKLNSVKFNIQGDTEDVVFTIREIKAIHRRVKKRLYPDRGGFYHYSLEDVERAGVPLSIVLRTLELLNDRPCIKGDELVTSVSWEEFLMVLGRIRELLEDIAQITTRQIREVVVPIALAFRLSPEDVLDMLLQIGAAVWREDKFKYELVKNKEHAMESVLSELRGGDENEN